MMKYRGKYIDHVFYNSKKDIDDAIKNELIANIKKYTKMMFTGRYSASEQMTLSGWISDSERQLHDEFGMDWADIEELEVIA